MKRKCVVIGLSAATEGVQVVLQPAGEPSACAFGLFVPDVALCALAPLTIGRELVMDVTAAPAEIPLAA